MLKIVLMVRRRPPPLGVRGRPAPLPLRRFDERSQNRKVFRKRLDLDFSDAPDCRVPLRWVLGPPPPSCDQFCRCVWCAWKHCWGEGAGEEQGREKDARAAHEEPEISPPLHHRQAAVPWVLLLGSTVRQACQASRC